jgi:hypothetical protein
MAVRLLWGRRGRGLLVRPWLGMRGSIVVRPWLLRISQLIGLRLSLDCLLVFAMPVARTSKVGAEVSWGQLWARARTSSSRILSLSCRYRQHFTAITNHPKERSEIRCVNKTKQGIF